MTPAVALLARGQVVYGGYQFRGLYTQGGCNLSDVVKGNIALPSFYRTHVVRMEVCVFRDLLLCKFNLLAPKSHRGAKGFEQRLLRW